MTISEAIKEWKISEKTMCKYLENGLISGVRIENNVPIIPDLPALLIPRKNTNITVEKVAHYILKASDEFKYIDAHILHIEQAHFSAILKELERTSLLKASVEVPDYHSNKNFLTTEEGKKKMNSKKLRLEEITFSLNFNYVGIEAKFTRGDES